MGGGARGIVLRGLAEGRQRLVELSQALQRLPETVPRFRVIGPDTESGTERLFGFNITLLFVQEITQIEVRCGALWIEGNCSAVCSFRSIVLPEFR